MTTDRRLADADAAYQQAVFAGDPGAMPAAERGLAALEADTALARGRLLHARFLDRQDDGEDPAELELFERAARLYDEVADARGKGEAEFWIGIVHQVVRGDHEAAVPRFESALTLATEAGDDLTRSYALRHLGIVAQVDGDLATARERLEESTRLRRELGFPAGVAANLVGLAYLAAEGDRGADVRTILDEATAVAASPEAAGVRKWVEEARSELRRFL